MFFYLFLVNRRLDEWLDISRLDNLAPAVKEPAATTKVTTSNTSLPADITLENSDRKLTRNQKRKHDEINHVQKVRLFLFVILILITNNFFEKRHLPGLADSDNVQSFICTQFTNFTVVTS